MEGQRFIAAWIAAKTLFAAKRATRVSRSSLRASAPAEPPDLPRAGPGNPFFAARGRSSGSAGSCQAASGRVGGAVPFWIAKKEKDGERLSVGGAEEETNAADAGNGGYWVDSPAGPPRCWSCAAGCARPSTGRKTSRAGPRWLESGRRYNLNKKLSNRKGNAPA